MPNEPAKITIDLRDRYHRFLKGHRIMVQMQSTWFPVIDRNPQTFVNIYKAKAERLPRGDAAGLSQRVAPSHLVVPVVPAEKTDK